MNKKFEEREPKYDVLLDYTLKMDLQICSIENCNNRAIITIQNCNKDYIFCESCSIAFILDKIPPNRERKRLFDLITDIIELKSMDKRLQEGKAFQKKIDSLILKQNREKRKLLEETRKDIRKSTIELIDNALKWFLVIYNFHRAKIAIDIWRNSTMELKDLGLLGREYHKDVFDDPIPEELKIYVKKEEKK